MTPTAQDITLLHMIAKAGGTVPTDGNIDRAPFERLVQLGWASSTSLNVSSVEYALTPTGRTKAAVD